MFEFLGDIERAISALYPVRVPLTIGIVGTVAMAVVVAWRRGWLPSAVLIARRRPAASLAIVAVLLLVTVPAGWYLASPLWTRTTLVEASPIEAARQPEDSPAASMQLPAGMPEPSPSPTLTSDPVEPTPSSVVPSGDASVPFAVREVRRGEWIGADEFHFAEGQALIIETEPGHYVLRVEEFSVRNGPDLFVYLSPSPDGYADGGLNLGELKATDGAFNYEIPANTDVAAYRSAVIWCEQFAVLFATATLSP